ncbi:C45 family autoproteolytic acyltransferase/hydrolase [Nonomuraea sp. NPDC050556]|uniref:C45 family autoproteolytic acyltransferase/hydolase n=1 Tax=Nonomuraea sp. NPDC050556 TaxID=3364369 RepID=UPI0037B8339A
MNSITQVAGSTHDFQLVRHLETAGSQFAIGRAMAEEARERLGWAPQPADPTVNRARMTWFERNWPQHLARLDGVADAFGVDPDDDSLTLDGLSGLPMACSALWVPPSAAPDGHGRIGRNYDFFTITMSELMGAPPREGELPIAARPYVITTRPDEGLASVVITMSGLDGCMDGVNEAGLSVALLIADATTAAPPEDTSPQVGVDSVQLPRFLLDTCENVAQAKQALLGAKQYDHGMPLHYIVADADGNAFVWESERIFEVGDAPLCVTNHLLHSHPDPMALPEDTDDTLESYGRLRSLYERSKGATMSGDDIRQALEAVSPTPDKAWRTTWSTVFDTHDRTLSTRFYLGDEAGYSGELLFSAAR